MYGRPHISGVDSAMYSLYYYFVPRYTVDVSKGAKYIVSLCFVYGMILLL